MNRLITFGQGGPRLHLPYCPRAQDSRAELVLFAPPGIAECSICLDGPKMDSSSESPATQIVVTIGPAPIESRKCARCAKPAVSPKSLLLGGLEFVMCHPLRLDGEGDCYSIVSRGLIGSRQGVML